MALHLLSSQAYALFSLEGGLTSPHLLSALVAPEWTLEGNFSFDISAGLKSDGKSVFQLIWDNSPTSASIAAESQLSSVSPKVSLFQLDLTRYGLGTAYFTPQVGKRGQTISFGGQQYMPFPVEAAGFEWNSQGQFPRPRMTVGLGDLVHGDGGKSFSLMQSLLMSGDDLVGCEVRRIMTHAKFLDDGELPTAEATYPVEVWRIERKVRENKHLVEFELASFLDNENARLPGRQMMRNGCYFIYRWWDDEKGWQIDQHAPCPYMGKVV